jgi:hypothetical protein
MRAYVGRRGNVGMSFGCLGTVVVGAVLIVAAGIALLYGAFRGVRYMLERPARPKVPRAPRVRTPRIPGQPMWPRPLREDRRPGRR